MPAIVARGVRGGVYRVGSCHHLPQDAIEEAKKRETRARRLARAVEMVRARPARRG